MAPRPARYVLLAALLTLPSCVAVRRESATGPGHVSADADSSQVDDLLVAVKMDDQLLQDIAIPNLFESVKNVFNLAKEKYKAAKAFIVNTVKEAKEKWTKVRGSLDGAVEAAKELSQAVTRFVTILSNIATSVAEHGLQFIFDGLISLDDLKVFTKLKECWAITKEILSTAFHMRAIIDWGWHMLDLVRSIRALAGFAVDKIKDLISGDWLNGNESNIYDENAGPHVSVKTVVEGDVALSSWGIVDVVVPWFENAWQRAQEGALERLYATIKTGINVFQKSEKAIVNISNFLKPLMEGEGFDLWNVADRAVWLASNSGQLIDTFLAIGSEYTTLQNAVTQTYKPMIDQSREVTVSFKLDADEYTPGRIEKSKCSKVSVRLFRSTVDVDESSMWCVNAFFGRKVCGCRQRSTDCYVSKRWRPAPSEKARCFVPFVPQDDDFYADA
eukprot:TRINITY_DN15968_c0_g1_i1.p1 TRINITY_DN15968_c0_g1~~TRINITY_DN15968_c0_g1_i1.p1  ORF type:complete len:463 (+),score=76.46 TRINITY_DN15968_c0_g1_i1:57-1391(+)